MPIQAITEARKRAQETLTRFPVGLAAAAVATTAAWLLVEGGNQGRTIRLLLAALLGLPLATALHLVAEERQWRRLSAGAAGLGVIAALGVFYRQAGSWPDPLLAARFAQLTLGAHLLVSFLPFQGRPETAGFWQFNRSLFERFLLATVFAVVLFAGLAIALVALDQLFGVPVGRGVYPRLFAIIALLFHPWFVLGGVPKNLPALDDRPDYPVVLKVFAQYILIPIVTVYLVILTAYLGRIIVTRAWPSGWIGYLVSSVATAGTLALLLVHPIRDRREGRWIDPFARWLFIALIPSLAMLLLAVGKRIDQYGITEPRYALAILGWWLLILALFYAFTRSKSIRIIPVSLGLVALLTAAGPWGMAATSRRSEIARFQRLASERATAIRGGETDRRSRQELTEVARYLWNVHGAGALATAINVPPDTVQGWAGGEANAPIRLALRAIGTEPLWEAPLVRGDAVVSFTFLPADTSALEAIDVPPGTVLFGPGELFRPLSLRYRSDTLRVVPQRGAGVLEFRWGSAVVSVPIGAIIDSIAGPGGGRRQLQRRSPIVALGSRSAPLDIRLVITTAHWPKVDTSSRSAGGTILIAPR